MIQEPVFAAVPGQALQGRLYTGEMLSGQKQGKAAWTNDILDLHEGGHVTFPHRGDFEVKQPLSVECWLWLDQAGKSPVILSCGEWRKAGWFLQRLGDQWRWHVGGVDCDGGKPPLGRWVHLVGIFDGSSLRLFENGVQVAEAKGDIKTDAWPGDLHVGQYSAGPTPDFQVNGRITGVKIYHRPLGASEISAAAKSKPSQDR